ncbi:hypothetical protein F3Y22_tig00110580pilonHSYRG00088 [Hibiscus syriacus]|uniref:ABC-2 type transporter transmembrane domain-containing protein n=1 Tax=Hibiscus syriacus TaxID=106335 RepID=A0A6A3A4U8_HIBSY|nr:hypothetical protein F3Y22_tig00110580pilonHSYRG00088 [Hibiscus syriacus]
MCSDTLVGNETRRGISGSEKKRLTTGEMLVGPAKAFFMDEISTGLDRCTTYQICKFMRQMVHIMDGQIVYQGPTECVLEFFEYMGFKCPERKGIADFLQEGFNSFHIAQQLESDLRVPYERSVAHHHALVTEKIIQITITSTIAMTVFFRKEMHAGDLQGGSKFLGALFYSLINVTFNDPIFISGIWICITYYTIGFAAAAGRFFRQFLAFISIHQMALSLYRFIAAVGRTLVIANTLGTFTMLIIFVLGGFIVAKGK